MHLHFVYNNTFNNIIYETNKNIFSIKIYKKYKRSITFTETNKIMLH